MEKQKNTRSILGRLRSLEHKEHEKDGSAGFSSRIRTGRIRWTALCSIGLTAATIITLIVTPLAPVQTASANDTVQPVETPTHTLGSVSYSMRSSPMLVETEITAEPVAKEVPAVTRNPILRRTVRSVYVTALQARLMELGYLDLDEPTDYYGGATAYAVWLFQRQHKLAQDGVAGEETLGILFSNLAEKYVLRFGDVGADIENIQLKLNELGYYYGTIDGIYGDITITAVKKFQERNALTPDGLVGEKTYEKLFSPDAVQSQELIQQQISRANIEKMVKTAYAQLGKRYVGGGIGPNYFDCSGLVYYCMKQAGSNLGRYNAQGYANVSSWTKITSIYSLKRGDLIFFFDGNSSRVGHVGIYVGGGMMIDASSAKGRVVYRSCQTSYWINHFAWGRRPW